MQKELKFGVFLGSDFLSFEFSIDEKSTVQTGPEYGRSLGYIDQRIGNA
jgi:hypothetical protein